MTEIPKVSTLTLTSLKRVLQSPKLTAEEKAEFLRTNKDAVETVLSTELDSTEYKLFMEKRPLMSFRPIKNYFTQGGDKILLGKALDIPMDRLDKYVEEVANALNDISKMNAISRDKIKSVRTYVYRHGKKTQVVKFLSHELSESTNIENTLRRTLVYGTGGVADYFSRPIHKMDEHTFIDLYSAINNNLSVAEANNKISSENAAGLADWALTQLCTIQYNSKLVNAIKRKN